MTKIALTENSQTGERISYGWNENIEVAAVAAYLAYHLQWSVNQ